MSHVALIVILCPPRSYSSVVSSMLGQHPQLRATAENALLHYPSVREWLEKAEGHPQFGLGAQRTVAELLLGGVSDETMAQATELIRARADQPSSALMDELIVAAQPQVLVEKSPLTFAPRSTLERIASRYPRVRFLHLTRHPHESIRSMIRYRTEWHHGQDEGLEAGAPILWQMAHQTVRRFLDDQPADTWVRVRGEDVVGDPVGVLGPVLGAWGLRTDDQALQAMLHPERSPHAQHPEFGGNGLDFLASPTLRGVAVPPERLLPPEAIGSPALERSMAALAEHFGYRVGTVPTHTG